MTELVVTTGHHRTIGYQSDRMVITGGDCHDICPLGYIALTVLIFSTGHHRTIGFQPDHMAVTGGNCHDICPAGYIALTVLIVTTGYHRTIGSQPDRMVVTGGNFHDICPAGYITIRLVTTGHHRTIGFQPDRMGVTDGNHTWRMAVIVYWQLFRQIFPAAVCFLYALLFLLLKPFCVLIGKPFCVGQFVCQRTACKLPGALIFAALHHLDDIRTSFLPRSDPPCRQQQHHISVRTLRVNIQHLLGVLCSELGILVLQKHLRSLQ